MTPREQLERMVEVANTRFGTEKKIQAALRELVEIHEPNQQIFKGERLPPIWTLFDKVVLAKAVLAIPELEL